MALEGIVLNSGSGGQTLATDTVGGFDFQIIKIGYGVDDSTPTSVSDTNPLPIDDAGGSLTVDNAGTFAVQVDGSALTALQLIDNIVSVEDAVHASGDSGVMALAVRNDALAALAGADGDYAPLQVNASGALFIQQGAALDVSGATVPVSNAGTFATQVDGSALTALQLIDDAVFADDAAFTLASSKVSMAGGIRDDALSTLTAIEGDAVPFRVNSTGALHVTGAAGVTEFNEDAASAGGEAGNLALGVRRDADTTPVTTDGDFHTLVFDASGNLKVNVKAGAAGGVVHTDDAAFTVATDDIVPIGGMFDDTAPDSVDEGDAGVVRMSANRNLYATLRDAAGNERGVNVDASNRLTVSVDNNPVLGAGTNAFGKLSANSGVDIGDVDILSVTPGTAAANLGKAEDAVHASGDTGVMGLAVLKATPVNLSGADGDYEPLQISAGRLWTSATIDAALPAGTNAIGKLAANSGVDIGDVDVLSLIPGTGAADLGKAVDAVAGATDTGVAVLAIRDDTLTTLTPVDGDYVHLRVNSTGALHVTGGGGGTEYTEDEVTANPIIGMATLIERDDALTTVTPIEGDFIGLRGTAEGALWVQDFNSDAILADTSTIAGAVSAGQMQVDVVAALPAGTNAIGKLAANSGVDIGDVDVTSQPARAATTDNIGAKLATDAVMDGTTALTPKYAIIAATASGDTAVVADVTNKKIRVLSLAINAFGNTEVEFQDNGTTTTRSGNFDMGTSSGKAKGLVLAFSPVGHFETASGVGLDITLTQSVVVEGHLVYVEV